VKKLVLATPDPILSTGDSSEEAAKKKAAAEVCYALSARPDRETAAHLAKERLQMLAPAVLAAYRKPEKQRSWEEQKMVEDYFVPIRVDPIKVKGALSPARRTSMKRFRRS
jgi:hypothetical protein